jgi:hypothetical protein
MVAPIPLAAPVTTTTFPFNLLILLLSPESKAAFATLSAAVKLFIDAAEATLKTSCLSK